MAINFNQDTVFNLRPISVDSVKKEVNSLLVDGEYVAEAFQTIRDQLIFTNKRIIAIDVQDLTGVKKAFTSMPYSRIQYFTIQTAGLVELFPDNELELIFSNGFVARFEIKGRSNITEVARLISDYILD